jgi:hypothetical protein
MPAGCRALRSNICILSQHGLHAEPATVWWVAQLRARIGRRFRCLYVLLAGGCRFTKNWASSRTCGQMKKGIGLRGGCSAVPHDPAILIHTTESALHGGTAHTASCTVFGDDSGGRAWGVSVIGVLGGLWAPALRCNCQWLAWSAES